MTDSNDTKNVDLLEFDPLRLDEKYENVRRSRDTDIGSKATYWVRDKIGNDAGSISTGRELIIYVDNFPRQKAYYISQIPVRTWEELENDAARCGLPLISNY